jgi:uncharacterized protein (DUF1330 family)
MILDKIDPTKESIKALATEYPKDTPVTMLNILKFKAKADGKDETGMEAYKRYSANAAKHLEKSGGKLIYAGEVTNTVIGDMEDQPHQVLLIEYPSVNHFLNMVMTPEYQAISKDRTIALEYGGLMACKKMTK